MNTKHAKHKEIERNMKTRKTHKWTVGEVARMVRMRKAGSSWDEIGYVFGIFSAQAWQLVNRGRKKRL